MSDDRERVGVLHIITLSSWGGAQQVCHDIATHMDKRRYLTEVACAGGGELVERLRERGVVVHEVNSLGRNISVLRDLRAVVELCRLIRKGRYSIVHCHSSKAGMAGRLAAWLAGTPRRYFTAHGWGFYNAQEYGHMRRLLILSERLCARISTKVVCVSESVRRDGVKERIAKEGKFVVIRNGLAPDNAARTKRDFLRNMIGARGGDTVFGMVARLAYPKDPLLFLGAARRVREAHCGAKFVLMGAGPLYAECEEFVKVEGLEESVFLLGFRGDARELLAGLDVFVLCSRFEGLPVTIIEAMFSGLPVIAGNVGGIGELVEHRRNGFLISPNDVDELTEAMIEIIKNPSDRVRMGRESREMAVAYYTVDRMIAGYQSLYEDEECQTDGVCR
ncbi:MAG: glycosyltransferase family 4 protein [Phycisphaerales bacterium]|nr:MAG: glycosyltransferase family 4 protein [Phycisphaerales bacterium]